MKYKSNNTLRDNYDMDTERNQTLIEDIKRRNLELIHMRRELRAKYLEIFQLDK